MNAMLDMEEAIRRNLPRCEVLSVRRNSITLHVDGLEDLFIPEMVIKSYSPPSFYEELHKNPDFQKKRVDLPEEDYFSGKLEYFRLSPIYYFHKAVALYEASNKLPPSERFLPHLFGKNTANSSLLMDYVPAQDYRSYLLSGEDTLRKTTELVDELVKLHGIFGRNFEQLYQAARWGSLPGGFTYGLRPRMWQEEKNRFLEYFHILVYECSEDFRKYCGTDKVQHRLEAFPHKRKEINRIINSFLREKGLNLEKFVERFLYRDRLITGKDILGKEKMVAGAGELRALYQTGKVTIVHGDFNPQNIFRAEPGLDIVTVCDPDEMHVDNRHLDLAQALYSIYNMPHSSEREEAHLELIRRYVRGVKATECIELNFDEFLIGTLETRLRERIHLFAFDCRLNVPEIRSFTNGIAKFESTPEQELKDSFLREMFIESFQDFFSYLQGEDGPRLSSKPYAKEFYRQVKEVEEFFHKSGIVVDKGLSRSGWRKVLETILGGS